MYAFFDLETTGLNSLLDEICEVAVLIYDKNFKLKKEFRTLLKTHNPIPEDVTLIHGITNEMVKDKPYFQDVAREVFELLENMILCGQNIRTFDIPFLAEQLFNCDIIFDTTKFRYLDTLLIEQKLKKRDLSTLYQLYTGKELEDAHSASADCKAAKEVLMGQIKQFDLDVTKDDFNLTLGITDKRVDPSGKLLYIDGVACWSFGKNKNKPVSQDVDYAKWVITSDFPKSTKFYVQKEIDKINK